MERPNLSWIYLQKDGTPRNYEPPEMSDGISIEDYLRVELEADVDAFKKTQAFVAMGIVGVGGAIVNTINPPGGDAIEFLKNMSVPVAVQTLNYVSFRKGVHLMRSRANERQEPQAPNEHK